MIAQTPEERARIREEALRREGIQGDVAHVHRGRAARLGRITDLSIAGRGKRWADKATEKDPERQREVAAIEAATEILEEP